MRLGGRSADQGAGVAEAACRMSNRAEHAPAASRQGQTVSICGGMVGAVSLAFGADREPTRVSGPTSHAQWRYIQ